ATGYEQDQRASRVEKEIGPVKPARPIAEKSRIQLEGQPSQRVPIAGVECGKSPGHSMDIKSGPYLLISGDVIGIVQAKEAVLEPVGRLRGGPPFKTRY